MHRSEGSSHSHRTEAGEKKDDTEGDVKNPKGKDQAWRASFGKFIKLFFIFFADQVRKDNDINNVETRSCFKINIFYSLLKRWRLTVTSTSFMLSRDWRVDLNLSTIARRRVNKAPASLSGWNALLHRVSLSSSCQRLTFQPSPAFGCDLPSSFVKSAQKCFWRTFFFRNRALFSPLVAGSYQELFIRSKDSTRPNIRGREQRKKDKPRRYYFSLDLHIAA